MLGLAMTLLLCAPDGGAAVSIAPLLEELVAARLAHDAGRLARLVETTRAAQESATPEERALLERMVRLVELEPDAPTTFRGALQLHRDALQVWARDLPSALASMVTSNPAIRGQLKTGQRASVRDTHQLLRRLA